MSSSTWASIAQGGSSTQTPTIATTTTTRKATSITPGTAGSTTTNGSSNSASSNARSRGGVKQNSPRQTATRSTEPGPPHQRKEAHQPRSGTNGGGGGGHGDEEYYIVSLLTDSKHHADMSALRKKWFPRKLLKVDAHITLFHALPGSKLDEVKRDIARTTSAMRKFDVRVGGGDVFRMGKGVGVEMDRVSLARVRDLREGLRAKWEGEEDADGVGWLSEQDARRGWKGHYTVMNKEDDGERVQACLEDLKSDWHGSQGVASGLSLWRYDRGWWKKTEDFLFGDGR